MQRLAFPVIPLSIFLLCCAVRGDTFELPRPNKDTFPGNRYDITAAQWEDSKLIAEQLGHLSHVWDMLFVKLMKDAKIEPAVLRHQVILYHNQREYIAHLLRIEPAIARTNGFYHAPGRTAYFFSAEARILFHEGTHQILAERFFYDKTPDFRNNYWVIEGIALLMETLRIEEDRYVIGDIFANRLYSAKVYRFERGHNLSIERLTAMSASDIQSSRDLQQIYSQSAALTHWLMFAEHGRYRTALFELLRRTYCDLATPNTLSELTGFSYEELDARYTEFLKTIPDEP